MRICSLSGNVNPGLSLLKTSSLKKNGIAFFIGSVLIELIAWTKDLVSRRIVQKFKFRSGKASKFPKPGPNTIPKSYIKRVLTTINLIIPTHNISSQDFYTRDYNTLNSKATSFRAQLSSSLFAFF